MSGVRAGPARYTRRERTLSPMPVDGALRAELLAMLAEHRADAALARDDSSAGRRAAARSTGATPTHLGHPRRLRGVARTPARRRRRRAGGVDHRAGGDRRPRAAAPLPRAARGRRRRSATPTRMHYALPARPRAHGRRPPPALRLAVRGRRHGRPRAVAHRRPRGGRRAPRRVGLPPFADHARGDAPTQYHARGLAQSQPSAASSARASSTTPPPTGTAGTPHRAPRARAASASRPGRADRRSPCARRSRRPATRRDGRAGTSGTSPRSSARCRAPARARATTSSSERAPTRVERTSPSTTCSARSRIDAVLLPESPAARSDSARGREHRLGGRRAVEQRLEPAVDRARRRAGELLVADRAGELGEVRAARTARAELRRALR